MRNNRKFSIKNAILRHVDNNKKEYILFLLIFTVGIFLGVMFINNIKEEQITQITDYLNKFINTLKDTEQLDNMRILKSTIFENILLGVALWFFGTTVIRNTYSFRNYII